MSNNKIMNDKINDMFTHHPLEAFPNFKPSEQLLELQQEMITMQQRFGEIVKYLRAFENKSIQLWREKK